VVPTLLPLWTAVFGIARADGTCDGWSAAQDLGVVQGTLAEISGMASSRANEGVLWMHDDAGAAAEIHAIGQDGASLGTFNVPDADNQDWEDVAVGPCGDELQVCSCLYVGDIGDNDRTRAEVVIYRIPEFTVEGAGSDAPPAEALWFQYPDGPHDAEAMVVDPYTGRVVVFTKEPDGPTFAWTFPDVPAEPADQDDPAELVLFATLDLEESSAEETLVTGASLSPDGRRLVLRTDQDLLLYEGADLETALAVDPVRLPVPEGGDAEAVAFSVDGVSLYVAGEGEDPTLWEVRCAAFTASSDPDPLSLCSAADGGCGCRATLAGLDVSSPRGLAWLAVGFALYFFGSRARGAWPRSG
jgi:hypothetical protein